MEQERETPQEAEGGSRPAQLRKVPSTPINQPSDQPI